MKRSIKNGKKQVGTGEAGFTLLEVLMGLVILSIGLLLMSGAHITATRSNSKGFGMTSAAALAESRLEQIRLMSSADPALTAGPHADPDETFNGITYSMGYEVADGDPVAGVKKITYTVTWKDNIDHTLVFFTRL